jgi:hypothetical protein
MLRQGDRAGRVRLCDSRRGDAEKGKMRGVLGRRSD